MATKLSPADVQKYAAFITSTLKYKVKKVAGSKITLFAKSSDRMSELKSLQKSFKNSTWENKDSSVGRLFLKDNGVMIYLKDETVGSESLGIKAEAMVKMGKSIVRSKWIAGGGVEFDSVVHTDARTLRASVVAAFKANAKTKNLAPFIDQLFDRKNYKKIPWPHDVPENERAQIAKYVGEVLVGYMALDGNYSCIRNLNPGKKATAVIFPMSANMKGIDSIIVVGSKQYPVSSKSGTGASASWFANIAPYAIKHLNDFKSSELKTIATFIARSGVAPDKSGEAIKLLYRYGLSVMKIKDIDPLRLLTKVKAHNKRDPEVIHMMSEIKMRGEKFLNDPRTLHEVISKFPASISGFFSRMIAKRLNSDPASIQQMKDLIAAKGFWQVNLDKNKFIKDNGEIIFDAKVSKGGINSLKIIASKGQLTDPGLNRGLLNYELK